MDLFRDFESTPEEDGSWLYRYYSGFAHGKQWAILLNTNQRSDFDDNGHAVARVESNDEVVAELMELATFATVKAVDSFSRLQNATN